MSLKLKLMNIYSENVVAQSIDRETDMKVVLRVQKRTIFRIFREIRS